MIKGLIVLLREIHHLKLRYAVIMLIRLYLPRSLLMILRERGTYISHEIDDDMEFMSISSPL